MYFKQGQSLHRVMIRWLFFIAMICIVPKHLNTELLTTKYPSSLLTCRRYEKRKPSFAKTYS